MRTLSSALVRYYVALRLSSGAATALLPFDVPQEREAIVRTSKPALSGGMDPRELIRREDLLDVITIPLDHATRDRGVVGLN